MNNRRLAILAGLGIVELWIVGLMIRSVSGGRNESVYPASAPNVAFASGQQNAPGRDVSRSVDAGAQPHVVIDDRNATLTVSVRPGTTVSVTEQTVVRGWVHGTRHPIKVERTADGVRIERGDGPLDVMMGSVERRLDVVVPPASRLDVTNAGSTTVSGLRADATLHSDDGSISVSDHRGGIDVRTDDGRVELHDVEAPSVSVRSDDGRVVLDRVVADTVDATTDDGRIEVARSLLRGGKIATKSGRVNLGLDPRSDVTVSARTSSGKVIAKAPLTAVGGGNDDETQQSTIRVGNGSGSLEVGTDDGSITVAAGGV
jgi:hypothetical protein